MKICSIGCGSLAFHQHGPSQKLYSRRFQDAVLSGCCDTDMEKAREYARKFGFERAYSDYKQMLEAEKPDAVCLIVPVSVTKKIAVDILHMGYPLLMEKPPGINIEQTKQILEAAGNTNNLVAFNRRYVPLVKKLREYTADSRELSVRCDFLRVNRFDEDFSTTAIHGIDTVGYIVNSPYKQVIFRYRQMTSGAVNVFMSCTFESGAYADLSFCPTAGIYMENYLVNDANATYILEIPSPQSPMPHGGLKVYRENKLMSEQDCCGLSVMESAGFYFENEEFFESVRANKRRNDVLTCLQSVEIAECMRMGKDFWALDI